jgi:hypothetical protein
VTLEKYFPGLVRLVGTRSTGIMQRKVQKKINKQMFINDTEKK